MYGGQILYACQPFCLLTLNKISHPGGAAAHYSLSMQVCSRTGNTENLQCDFGLHMQCLTV